MKRPSSSTPEIAASISARSGSSGVRVSNRGTKEPTLPTLAPNMSVGIVGLGYVGLPLAVAFAEEGEDVVALDVDARKIEAIKRGESYIEDIPSERLDAIKDKIEATTRPAALAHADAIIICVP